MLGTEFRRVTCGRQMVVNVNALRHSLGGLRRE